MPPRAAALWCCHSVRCGERRLGRSLKRARAPGTLAPCGTYLPRCWMRVGPGASRAQRRHARRRRARLSRGRPAGRQHRASAVAPAPTDPPPKQTLQFVSVTNSGTMPPKTMQKLADDLRKLSFTVKLPPEQPPVVPHDSALQLQAFSEKRTAHKLPCLLCRVSRLDGGGVPGPEEGAGGCARDPHTLSGGRGAPTRTRRLRAAPLRVVS